MTYILPPVSEELCCTTLQMSKIDVNKSWFHSLKISNELSVFPSCACIKESELLFYMFFVTPQSPLQENVHKWNNYEIMTSIKQLVHLYRRMRIVGSPSLIHVIKSPFYYVANFKPSNLGVKTMFSNWQN